LPGMTSNERSEWFPIARFRLSSRADRAGGCPEPSGCLAYGADAPPLNMTDTEQSCIVNCAL